ncbi:hypothetical protein [Maribacter sp. Asnod2-G09]|uniref:hypothetical protein n=1 Tax=Maribacter sp. Asnod2-G09 TaxID=3160577 RepID=UPI00386643F7
MKNILTLITLFCTSITLACGGGEWYGGFYNLFKQTNISAEEFYPFLRDEYNHFYEEHYYYDANAKKVYPKGNVKLWESILTKWTTKEIEKAVYNYDQFNWENKNSALEKNAKTYLAFAQKCSEMFSYRSARSTWDYEKALLQSEYKEQDAQALVAEANTLLSTITNEQLKARYYYQIIRALHYTKNYSEAITFFENTIKNKVTKNEIYYYILDQVAGCHYSSGNYDLAAYYFTKVLNKSVDRKKTAFNSFNFCTFKNVDGAHYSKGIEDEKDLLLIRSLRDFSDEINNIKKFIALDANDARVELLFMRALSNVERDVWETDSYEHKKELPYLKANNKHANLLQVAEQQIASGVKNKDFWRMASSYLSFVNKDLTAAKHKLKEVKTFSDQKKILNIVYEVFTWETISPENENYIHKVLLENPIKKDESAEDWRLIILDKIAHTYLNNGEIAKSFLVHNSIQNTNKIQSLELLNDLEKFYLKPNKSDYEKQLIHINTNNKVNYLDYINYQKGLYYLYEQNPKQALVFFNKNKTYVGKKSIPALIFSNNIKECFDCVESEVMADEVYKAFPFIATTFSRKQLAENLIALEQLRQDEKQWKVKLANYLLGNYYFNISNTGYYRGLLTSNSNCCSYSYTFNDQIKEADAIIKNKENYNLSTIFLHDKNYFDMSSVAMQYYQNTIDLSTDRELNARCLYLMAKCELNRFYNVGVSATFEVKENEYYTFKLPQYKSFKTLEEEYSSTDFYNMIIDECSYFKLYTSQ